MTQKNAEIWTKKYYGNKYFKKVLVPDLNFSLWSHEKKKLGKYFPYWNLDIIFVQFQESKILLGKRKFASAFKIANTGFFRKVVYQTI